MPADISAIIHSQQAFFAREVTRDIAFRQEQLARLKEVILAHEQELYRALRADLGKSETEAYFSELFLIFNEIGLLQRQIPRWAKPRTVKTPLFQQPAKSLLVPEPLGRVLIIAPWNYPFQLLFGPLVGAVAAGNCCVVKPSELAPQTSEVSARIIAEAFSPEHVVAVEGGIETSQQLLEQRFDHIFFTGGTEVGRLIMAAAARHLTPVTLELGGKSPCIVDGSVDLAAVARRITWGKFLNAGQTCVAPDYLLVQADMAQELIEALRGAIRSLYGADPRQSPDYSRIVNERHFARLAALLPHGRVRIGGELDVAERYLAPTLLDEVHLQSPLMTDEIFGPLLPLTTYQTHEEAIAFVNDRPQPLALYVFSRDDAFCERVIRSTSSGGVCVNDVLSHITTDTLPFGGIGESGMGQYHGKSSFDTFTHYKPVMKKGFALDLPLRYPPFRGKERLIAALRRIYG